MPDCAHLEIRPKATKLDNGICFQQWFCQACGAEFVPYLMAAIAQMRRDAMEKPLVSGFHIIDRILRTGYVPWKHELETWLARAKEVIDIE